MRSFNNITKQADRVSDVIASSAGTPDAGTNPFRAYSDDGNSGSTYYPKIRSLYLSRRDKYNSSRKILDFTTTHKKDSYSQGISYNISGGNWTKEYKVIEKPSVAKVAVQEKWIDCLFTTVISTVSVPKNVTLKQQIRPNNQKWVMEDPTATGFRLPRDYEWEYMARIITDERLIPDDSVIKQRSPKLDEEYDVVIKPTKENGYKHYFESAKGSYNSASSTQYMGSGASLAFWDDSSKKFDKTTLRGYQAASGREIGKTLTDTEADGDIFGVGNLNRRNGAGLYGMCGAFLQPTNTIMSYGTNDMGDADSSNILDRFTLRGGSYKNTANGNVGISSLATTTSRSYSLSSTSYTFPGYRRWGN